LIASVVGCGERGLGHARRLRVRVRVRRRAQVPRDAPPDGGSGKQQSRPRVPRTKRARHASVVLMEPLLRSLMFVPGHRPRMVQRALGLGDFAPNALAVAILDLEDGVPADEKDRARAAIAAVLGLPSHGRGPARYVRVNREAGARDADLAAVLRPGLDGIVAPKIDHPDEVAELARDLEKREAAAGTARGSLPRV